MKKIKNMIIFLLPFVVVLILTLLITINFSKLMPNDIDKMTKFELSDNESVVVFNDRINNINRSINIDDEAIYVDKYRDIINKIIQMQAQEYDDITYNKLIEFAQNNSFLNKNELQNRKRKLKGI